MIRIGIVGAENSHTAAIAKLINVDKDVKGAKVVALWGETEEFAAKAAATGQVETIVKKPQDLIGMVDGVMIDHRHAMHHLPAAEPFLKARLPMFIDKPFCFRAKQGDDFLKRARKARVPVTSFSSVILQKSFAQLKAQIAKLGQMVALTSTGPADINSKYGGVFFYGVHQVESVLALAGRDVKTVQVNAFKGGTRHTATLEFGSGMLATINLISGLKVGFHAVVHCEGGVVSYDFKSDKNSYTPGAGLFVKMFKTGAEPRPHDEIMMTIRVLEAMDKSIKTGKRVKV